MRIMTGLSGLPAGTAMTASCTDLYCALPSAATTSSTGAADATRAPAARQDRRHTAKHVAILEAKHLAVLEAKHDDARARWFILFIPPPTFSACAGLVSRRAAA